MMMQRPSRATVQHGQGSCSMVAKYVETRGCILHRGGVRLEHVVTACGALTA